MAELEQVPTGVDISRPSPARMYDYMLGGTHNFQVDRDATQEFQAQFPDLEDAAWANRGFHGRAARWMAITHGIEQFIDIGSGLPTQSNTHQVLQAVNPAARVVYVDNDPMVLATAQELLTGDGTTAVIQADLRDPDALFGNPDLRRLVNFDQPVGLLMTAVVQFVKDPDDPWRLVGRYVGALAPDSCLALSHITGDKMPPRSIATGVRIYTRATESAYPRTRAEIERFFDGLEIVAPYPGASPALCHVGVWGSEDPESADSDGSRVFWCAVARKP
ncbi:MAG TPA: SAM-dependent methyltransferase [Streptosporangiaceae bacterium]|nr:SAM-dependent methyltransferase [Streptosporangiaceae bacterium]